MRMEPQFIISKSAALSAYDGNGAALARALGLTKQAVSAMPDGPLLERHALKLRFVLKPEVFNQPDSPIPPASSQPDALCDARSVRDG